jgi:hypothetical protein
MALLVHVHLETLEDVELVDCKSIDHNLLSKIFSKCRNLKSVKIAPTPGPELVFLEDLVSKRWACSDLKDLHVAIHRYCLSIDKDEYEDECEDDDDDIDENNQAPVSRLDTLAKRMFRQIGRLSKLETLCLDYQVPSGSKQVHDTSDLTLDRGWLSELAGLKKLRHLTIPLDQIGQAEIEFMDSQWPQLEKISFIYGQSDYNVTEKPQWQWLKKRRPYLEYCGTGSEVV